MESTIEKLVDNLEKEKGLNSDEKGEMDRVLRTSAKGIEPDRIADFVKSMRKKIDAPVSKIFTKEGINFESLESAAKTEAKIVIKIQKEYSEKNKNEEKTDIKDDGTENIKKIKDKEKSDMDDMIKENLIFLDEYMPELDDITKDGWAQSIAETKMLDEKTEEYKKQGLSDKAAKAKACDDLGLENSELAETMRDADRIFIKEQDKKKVQQKNPQRNSDNESKSTSNKISNDTLDSTDKSGTVASEEDLDNERKHETMQNAIFAAKESIRLREKELEDLISKNIYPDAIKSKYKEIEKLKKDLRKYKRTDEVFRLRLGDKSVLKERDERNEFLITATQRYLKKENRESIVEIFEDMKKDALLKGIDLEEIIGFEDILKSVKLEIEKYPELVTSADTIIKNERTNYENHIKYKSLEIARENAERQRKEASGKGEKKAAEDYDELVRKYAKKKIKLDLKDLNNVDDNMVIKRKVNRLQAQEERKNEILMDVKPIDAEKIKDIKDPKEFISYATKMYFSSGKNVLEIFEEYKENCSSMGISAEDIINAVSREIREADMFDNYNTIKEYEKRLIRLPNIIKHLEEANRKAELKGNQLIIEWNNAKIKEYQDEINTKRMTTANIKKAVIFKKSQEKENAEVKKSDISAETKQEKRPEPKKKKGLFSFLRRAIPKKEIEPKDVNGETTTLNDLQREEVQEDKEQPKAVNENKTNNQLEVSTISVEGDELVTETTNKHVNEPEKSDAEDDVR